MFCSQDLLTADGIRRVLILPFIERVSSLPRNAISRNDSLSHLVEYNIRSKHTISIQIVFPGQSVADTEQK